MSSQVQVIDVRLHIIIVFFFYPQGSDGATRTGSVSSESSQGQDEDGMLAIK